MYIIWRKFCTEKMWRKWRKMTNKRQIKSCVAVYFDSLGKMTPPVIINQCKTTPPSHNKLGNIDSLCLIMTHLISPIEGFTVQFDLQNLIHYYDITTERIDLSSEILILGFGFEIWMENYVKKGSCNPILQYQTVSTEFS